MKESEVHQLIMDEETLRSSILSLLNIDGKDSKIEFVHEDQYPNGMYADFTVKKDDEVQAIIECKGSDIGVNDYVRGIGQILEYQHFADSNLSIKGYKYNKNVCSVYFLP